MEVATGTRPVIEVFGDDDDTAGGTCMRDFIHIADLADAHVLAFERLHTGGDSLLLNCGYGRGYSVRQVLEAVGSFAGPVAVRRVPRRSADAPAWSPVRALSAALP